MVVVVIVIFIMIGVVVVVVVVIMMVIRFLLGMLSVQYDGRCYAMSTSIHGPL